MKYKWFFSLILFFCLDATPAERDPPDFISFPLTSISTTTPIPSTTSTNSEDDDYLDDISIQDILSSDIDANEKVEKKIIDAIAEFSSDCNAYNGIDLPVDTFFFSKPFMSIDLDTEIEIMFHSFNVTTEESEAFNTKPHSISLRCESSTMGKVQVKLPKIIKITAELMVLQMSNSSNESAKQRITLNEGSISLILKNSSILKEYSSESTHLTKYETMVSSKLIYSDSEVHLKTDVKFQMAIYRKLETFFDEVELPIKQSFVEKLDEKLLINRISVPDICSKFITPDKSPKKVNLPFFNKNLNNLYVIPNAKLETWKGVTLSAGPIIIDGLSFFNSTEFIVVSNPISSPDGEGYYYRTLPKLDEPELKEVIVRIKTNDLKGKLDWSYNDKQKSFPFSVEFMQFEIKESKRFLYESKEGWQYDQYQNHRYYPPESYMRSDRSEFDINLHLGEIRFKSQKSNVCENENEFVKFVLSEYLKSAIVDSINNSLLARQARHNPPLFSNCNFL